MWLDWVEGVTRDKGVDGHEDEDNQTPPAVADTLQNLPVGIFEIMQGYMKYGSTFQVKGSDF